MIGTAAIETEVKDQAAVELIKNEEFACVTFVIGVGFQNTN